MRVDILISVRVRVRVRVSVSVSVRVMMRVMFRIRIRLRGCFSSHLWSHVDEQDRSDVIRSEIRARYDIVRYDNIVCHVNTHKDPSTGHLLQTLQIV